MEIVELITSGYEWSCPHCNHFNKVSGIPRTETITCSECEKECKIADFHHAYD